MNLINFIGIIIIILEWREYIMNNERRKSIKKVIDKMEHINDIVDLIISDIETIQSDEEDAYDNLPESFQDGLKGSDMQDAIDVMEESIEALEELKNIIEEKVKEIKVDLTII